MINFLNASGSVDMLQ